MIAIEMLLVAVLVAQAQAQRASPQSNAPHAPQSNAHPSSTTQSLARPPQAAPSAPAPQSAGPKKVVAPHPQSPSLGPSSAAAADPEDASVPAAPAVEPYEGSLAEGLAKMESLSDAKDHGEALAVGESLLAPTRILRWREEKLAEPGFFSRVVRASDPLFGFLGLEEHTPEERAAVCYAMGVVASRAEKLENATRSFERARELAGAGEVRLDATYNLGGIALDAGEAARKEIPELNPNAAQTPQPPPPPASGAPGAPSVPDPLELAKAAYLHARTELLQRLKLDWRDADTRANIELVQRRLDELDRIQRQREEQKKEQEQQDKDKDQQNKDQQNQDPKDKGEDSKDSKNEDENKDQPKPDEKPPEEKPKEEPKPEDPSKEEKPEDQGAAPQEEPTERLLTKEEMTRLFDLLQQAEAQGKKIERELRQMRRAKVKKDW